MTPRLERLLALSGVAFAVLLVVGFLISGGNTPDYAADDQEWLRWADGNEIKSRIGAFLVLLAGLAGLHFMATVRSMWGRVETTVRGSEQLARVAFAGGLVGITGITLAIVMLAGASAEGADADPTVTRAVASATLVGPFLVAAMGFAAFLAAGGFLRCAARSQRAGSALWRYSAPVPSASRSSHSSPGRARTACSATGFLSAGSPS